MQREIKFRAWDKKQKAFINGFNMIGFSTGQGAPNKKLQRFSDYWDLEDVELMQYTGLKDKNGKEIFEGDIYTLGDMNILSIVEWHDTGFMGRQSRTKGSYEGLQYWQSRIEVIGNIYKNQELLTQSPKGNEQNRN